MITLTPILLIVSSFFLYFCSFRYATILAFDVKVEREAQEMADSLGVKIFQADIIYHLFDKFTAYREELKQKKREEFRSIAVFPCKLKVSNERIIKWEIYIGWRTILRYYNYNKLAIDTLRYSFFTVEWNKLKKH